MGLFKKLSASFKDADAPPRDDARDSIAGMTTPEGRAQHMRFLASHPDCLNLRDARGKSALDHAALAGDTDTMMLLLDAGIKPEFYHDAITAACIGGSPSALAMLLAGGGVVTEQHVSSMRTVAGLVGDRSESGITGGYARAVRMMESALAVQEENRTAEAAGPTVLGRSMDIHKPLKLKVPA